MALWAHHPPALGSKLRPKRPQTAGERMRFRFRVRFHVLRSLGHFLTRSEAASPSQLRRLRRHKAGPLTACVEPDGPHYSSVTPPTARPSTIWRSKPAGPARQASFSTAQLRPRGGRQPQPPPKRAGGTLRRRASVASYPRSEPASPVAEGAPSRSRARHEAGQRRFLVRGEIQERRANRTGRPADDAQAGLDDADRVAATLVPQREIRNEEAPHRFAGERAVARMDGGEETLGVFRSEIEDRGGIRRNADRPIGGGENFRRRHPADIEPAGRQGCREDRSVAQHCHGRL